MRHGPKITDSKQDHDHLCGIFSYRNPALLQCRDFQSAPLMKGIPLLWTIRIEYPSSSLCGSSTSENFTAIHLVAIKCMSTCPSVDGSDWIQSRCLISTSNSDSFSCRVAFLIIELTKELKDINKSKVKIIEIWESELHDIIVVTIRWKEVNEESKTHELKNATASRWHIHLKMY